MTTVSAVAAPVPAARLVAERVAAVRLPPRQPLRRERGPHRPADRTGAVCVAVDAGIVAVLRGRTRPLRLVWVARSPRATWGDELVDQVLAGPDATTTVWDTARLGEPDLLRLAYAAYVSSGATGVVCVAPRGRALARALRRRGVPASDLAPTL